MECIIGNLTQEKRLKLFYLPGMVFFLKTGLLLVLKSLINCVRLTFSRPAYQLSKPFFVAWLVLYVVEVVVDAAAVGEAAVEEHAAEVLGHAVVVVPGTAEVEAVPGTAAVAPVPETAVVVPETAVVVPETVVVVPETVDVVEVAAVLDPVDTVVD